MNETSSSAFWEFGGRGREGRENISRCAPPPPPAIAATGSPSLPLSFPLPPEAGETTRSELSSFPPGASASVFFLAAPSQGRHWRDRGRMDGKRMEGDAAVENATREEERSALSSTTLSPLSGDGFSLLFLHFLSFLLPSVSSVHAAVLFFLRTGTTTTRQALPVPVRPLLRPPLPPLSCSCPNNDRSAFVRPPTLLLHRNGSRK